MHLRRCRGTEMAGEDRRRGGRAEELGRSARSYYESAHQAGHSIPTERALCYPYVL